MLKKGDIVRLTVSGEWALAMDAARFLGDPGWTTPQAAAFAVKVLSVTDSDGLWVEDAWSLQPSPKIKLLVPWAYIWGIALSDGFQSPRDIPGFHSAEKPKKAPAAVRRLLSKKQSTD